MLISPFLHFFVPLFFLHNRYLGIFLSDVENIATENVVIHIPKNSFSFVSGELMAVCESV